MFLRVQVLSQFHGVVKKNKYCRRFMLHILCLKLLLAIKTMTYILVYIQSRA